MLGRKVTVTRPRARHLDGSGEVELATYKHFNTEDLLGEMALERMVAGLSTRNYSAGLEPSREATTVRRIAELSRGFWGSVRRNYRMVRGKTGCPRFTAGDRGFVRL